MRFTVAAIAAAATSFSTPAVALQLQCMPREAIFDSLEASHGEVPAYRGVTATGSLFEVLVSPDGTWTAFFTFPDGLTCPVATGEGWRHVPGASNDPAA